MKSYYCAICEQWLRGKSQIDLEHFHQGFEADFMLYEPVGLATKTGDHIGIKPVYNGKHWRAGYIYINTGYSDHPVFGHEAGACLHYTYEAMKDQSDEYIEAATRAELIAKLKALPLVVRDDYPWFPFRNKEG